MKIEEVRKVTVVGAGVMGNGIAMTCARSGFETMMVDTNKDILERAYSQIKDGPFGLMRLVKKDKMTKQEMDNILSRIKSTTDVEEAARDSDVVIEAISENPELKKKVWQQYDKLCPKRTIFASNTSTIMITELASATSRPDKFIGMHWFNPAQVMTLIEVVRGILTSEETLNFMLDFSRKLGKNPVEAKDSPGFFTSHFLSSFIFRAVRMWEQGIAGIKEIDTMCKQGFGFPMGPFELMDLTGLDIYVEAGDYICSITGESVDKCPLTLRNLVAAGYIGHKAGSRGGWYDYYHISK